MPTLSGANNLRGSVIDDPLNVGLTTGDDCLVLVDGADTPITARGHSLYTPHIGDRLLLNKVDQYVEIVQALNLGPTPYSERWRAPGDEQDVAMVATSRVVLFPAVGDEQGITYDPITGHYTVLRSGTYVVLGGVGMNNDNAAQWWVQVHAGGEALNNLPMPTRTIASTPDAEAIVEFTLLTRLAVGDEIWVQIHPDPMGGPSDLVRGTRSRTHVTVAHLAD